ncbi:GDCCVxC domain-containing (seleno)protein [Gracilimonas sp.]
MNSSGMIKPKKDDCCVFCSHVDVSCPSIQMHRRVAEFAS